MAKLPRGLLKQLGITPTSRSKPAPLTSKMKKRMEEVKGITKGKRFEETKKIADAKDKKKRNKVDKKNTSPKMEAEKKASSKSRGEVKDSNKAKKLDASLDGPQTKSLLKTKSEKIAAKEGKTTQQLGKMSEPSESRYTAKSQMSMATKTAKGFDAAAETVDRLYAKMVDGRYTQKEYTTFISAQRRAKDAILKRGDTSLAKRFDLTKGMLNINPANPSDKVISKPVGKSISAKEAAEKIVSIRKKKGVAERRSIRLATPEQKASAKRLKLKKEKEEMGFSKGGMPTTYKGGVLNGHGKNYGKPGGYNMGGLAAPTAKQTGLKKLPSSVRNKMGYMYGGGMSNKKNMGSTDYRKGGLVIVIGTGKPMKTKKGKK